MFGFFKKREVEPAPAVHQAEEAASGELPAVGNDAFIADQPITGRAQDRFSRAPFATRIAQTIATRVDASSIVIGVFGPWGDGKTSVLEMMEEAFSDYAQAIVVRFNPWHFQTEDQLLRGFFATLADALGRSLPNMKERAGELLKKYGSVLSLASLTVGGIVQVKPGDTAKGLGEALSNVGLDELRKRIEQMLDEAKKRLVILVDDIDRLDRDETHAIFKLVKLSAGFRHTAYVLAFDDEVVSAALGERYGQGGAIAGRAFLEKIIQVPLHLPPADESSLRALALEGVVNALNQAGIELSKEQTDTFITHFDDVLLSKIETPRRAKLFSNALLFALPLLKGEANPADLMLVEGIRVMYPKLYKAIRDNPSLFLRAERDERRGARREGPSRIDSLIEEATPELTPEEREHVKSRLLQPLFPRIGNSMYDHEWDRIWSGQQKICSSEYFKRYFTYSVPEGDVPDAQIADFCNAAPHTTDEQRRALIQAFAERQALPRVVNRLRQREGTLSREQASALISVFTMNGDLLPRERGIMLIDSRARGGMLVAGLLRQLPSGPDRFAEAQRAIETATPIGFALECLRWTLSDTDTSLERRVLPVDDEAALKDVFAARIDREDTASSLYFSAPKDAPLLYRVWADANSVAVVRGRLQARFDNTPGDLDAFLACYEGEAWGMESGLPRPADFRREQYNAVTHLLSADYVAANLRARFGAELDSPLFHPDTEMGQARRIAHQFMAVHKHVITTAQRAPEDDEASADGAGFGNGEVD
jgi:hypothetical protein